MRTFLLLIALASSAACGSGPPAQGSADTGPDPADAGADAAPDAAPDGGGGGGAVAPDYAFVFDPAVVRTFHLVFTRADWDALQEDWGQDVPVTVEVGDEVFIDVAVHYKGNVSLDFAGEKKSFKLDFDDFVPDQRYHGLERLNLHNGFKDPTLMRENLSYALHAAFWHSFFGRQRSHGCVNLSAADARWLFDWVDPQLPDGWYGVWATDDHPGTRVVIRAGT